MEVFKEFSKEVFEECSGDKLINQHIWYLSLSLFLCLSPSLALSLSLSLCLSLSLSLLMEIFKGVLKEVCKECSIGLL